MPVDRFISFIITGVLLLASVSVASQSVLYEMGNMIVDDCEGTLLDSGNGPGQVVDDYDHNEDYTFTICIPGADSIVFTFFTFDTEYLFDTLRLFDGPDVTSPQIGSTYSGNLQTQTGNPPPGVIIAHSGCLTIHFKSDASLTAAGWTASWYATVEEPEEPVFDPIANPPCHSATLMISLDQSLPCDSIFANAFTLSGPNAPGIVNATAVNCIGGATSTIELTLIPSLSKSGNYYLTFTSNFLDACDNLLELTASTVFTVNDCPLEVEIIPSTDTICLGECLELVANIVGGDSTSYLYSWSHGIPAHAGPHSICPVNTTTYSITADDAGPAAGDVDSKTITVLDLPSIMPLADDTVCRNAIIWLAANPSGGIWGAPGMTAFDSTNGRFRANRAGVGTHPITYTDIVTGCFSSVDITVIQFTAGNPLLACPGTSPFPVPSGSPSGGFWTGPFIDSSGIFDPSTPGAHVVTYHAPNGCIGDNTVYVEDMVVQDDDTVCMSISPYYTLTFTPVGGRWSGPGIINNSLGRFDPSHASVVIGWNQLVYRSFNLECFDTVNLWVEPIDAGADFAACPQQPFFMIPAGNPPGGSWSGMGVTDPVTGMYDPAIGGGASYIDTLTYTVSGCIDNKILYVLQTTIDSDTIRFCAYSPRVRLNYDNTGVLPPGGVWSGPGIVFQFNDFFFEPDSAGPGTHTIYYEANTCVDSMVMVVIPAVSFQSVLALCKRSDPLNLIATPPGGVWAHFQGNGFSDPYNGTFDPAVAGEGDHLILYFTLPDSCVGLTYITVDSIVTVSMSGLEPFYCYKDTSIEIFVTPPGGIYTGDGVIDSFFNPALAGPGNHPLTYSVGSGACGVSTTRNVLVGDSIEVTSNFTDSAICYGDFTTLSINAKGGTGSNFDFIWDNGLPDGQFQTVSPTFTTVYTATISDGCSEPVQISINVEVHSQIMVSIDSLNIKRCYGEQGYARLNMFPHADYSYEWGSTSSQNEPYIIAPVSSSYPVTVTNEATGCAIVEFIELPGYERIRAFFVPNPNEAGCITLQDPVFQFIDLSEGGDYGFWEFGDETVADYQWGISPEHEFTDTGTYTVRLYLENEGRCSDSYSTQVCVRQKPVIFAPASFTPNHDGINDLFKITAFGLTYFEMYIFNRWGEMVFQTTNVNESWNGYYKDEIVPTGGYPYVIYYKGKNSGDKKQVHKGMVIVLR